MDKYVVLKGFELYEGEYSEKIDMFIYDLAEAGNVIYTDEYYIKYLRKGDYDKNVYEKKKRDMMDALKWEIETSTTLIVVNHPQMSKVSEIPAYMHSLIKFAFSNNKRVLFTDACPLITYSNGANYYTSYKVKLVGNLTLYNAYSNKPTVTLVAPVENEVRYDDIVNKIWNNINCRLMHTFDSDRSFEDNISIPSADLTDWVVIYNKEGEMSDRLIKLLKELLKEDVVILMKYCDYSNTYKDFVIDSFKRCFSYEEIKKDKHSVSTVVQEFRRLWLREV